MAEKISDPPLKDNPSSQEAHEEQQKLILEVASRVLEEGNRDPAKVFSVAQNLGVRANAIQNLRAYANKALFRIKRKPCIEQEPLAEGKHALALADASYVDKIEARILVRELLDLLNSDCDREIFVRLMRGQTCREIDAAMRLKPGSAEVRVTVCKKALRKTVQSKLNPSS